MPLAPGLARSLQDCGHDAVHAAFLGLGRASDTEIIARALGEGRTIITADLDYPRLLAIMGTTAPSLILFRGGDWSEADLVDRLSQVLAGLAEAELTESILVVERDRVRRRRLPIS
jgi:predicted nuclease of predicted toxin-antitoxin system